VGNAELNLIGGYNSDLTQKVYGTFTDFLGTLIISNGTVSGWKSNTFRGSRSGQSLRREKEIAL
jgi:hypothetical protein